MINIEKNVETALYKSAYQGLKIYFEPLKGKPFHITSLDIVEGSFQIKKTSTSTNNMQIGNMSADDLSMELMNPTDAWGIGKFDDVYFCGATMSPYLLVYDQTQDKMIETPFGVYIIDNQPRLLDTIKITAFSNVVRLDIPFTTDGLLFEKVNLRDIVEKGLQKAGLDHDGSIDVFPPKPHHFQNYSIDVTKIKSEQTITWRQVIKWCCECVGVNAISDENGVIKFVFYDKYTPDVLRDEDNLNLKTEDGEILLIDDTPTADFPLTPALRYADNSSEVAEEDVVITGFQFKVDDQLYPKNPAPVMDYGLQLENNLVFYALNENGREAMARTVNEKLAGFTYRPFKCNTISFPHLQTCDSVVYIKEGKQYHSIITDIVYKLNGDMTLTAKGKSKEQKAWEVLGALTPKQQAIIDSVSRKVDKTRDQLSSYENALLLFNEKMLHSMGLYKTVKDDPNGGIITYFHNKETLENSDTIYMFGASGFAWTTDGWKEGNPVWHYGFTSTGDAILNTIHAYKLSAELIETGYLRSQNGASWINMDDGTFRFISSDAETGELYGGLELDSEGWLSFHGRMKSFGGSLYTYISDIHPNENDRFVICDKSVGENQEVLAVTTFYDNDKSVYGARIYSPLSNKWNYSNLESRIDFHEDYLALVWGDLKKSAVTCKENAAYLKNEMAYIGVHAGDVEFATYAHDYIWINFYAPQFGNPPKQYKFGSGTSGGYADIVCADMYANRAVVGGTGAYSSCKMSVFGNLGVDGEAFAEKFTVWSDRTKKENIIEKSDMIALSKIGTMKFYSYDFKKTDKESEDDAVHVEFGTMFDEAPAEIQSVDRNGIDLYSYISLTAKAVQELSIKVEQQEKEISELKSKLPN